MQSAWSSALAHPPRISEIGVGTYLEGNESCPSGSWRFQVYVTPGTLHADGVNIPIGLGCVGIFPPKTRLQFSSRDRMIHACSHFMLNMPGMTPTVGTESAATPQVRDLGARFRVIHEGFLEAVFWAGSAPHRAQARLWDLLWAVAGPLPSAPAPGHHQVLIQALSYIERHLSGPLRAEAIAQACGYSQNQLLRIFRREFGHTIVAHVRKRRIDRARNLLLHSECAIQDIAREVGIQDIQVFNKMFRKELGVSPSALRSRQQQGNGDYRVADSI